MSDILGLGHYIEWTDTIFLLRHLLHTVVLLPSSAMKGYKTLILFVLHKGQVPLPCDGKLHNVLPLCGFNAMLFLPFSVKSYHVFRYLQDKLSEVAFQTSDKRRYLCAVHLDYGNTDYVPVIYDYT